MEDSGQNHSLALFLSLACCLGVSNLLRCCCAWLCPSITQKYEAKFTAMYCAVINFVGLFECGVKYIH